MPLKEAEALVAQEALVQNQRRARVPAKETSTQLSFPEEQGGDDSTQQGRVRDSRGYVPQISKKARLAEAKRHGQVRAKLLSKKSVEQQKVTDNILEKAATLSKSPQAPPKQNLPPTTHFQSQRKKKRAPNLSRNVTYHGFCEEKETCELPATKKGRKPKAKNNEEVEEDEGYDTADDDLFYDFEEEAVNAAQEGPSVVRGDSTYTEEQLPATDFVDMPDSRGTRATAAFTADMRASDIFLKMVRAEVFFPRWAEQTNKKYEQWKQRGVKIERMKKTMI